MKDAIAIAIARTRKKTGHYSPEPREGVRIEEEVSKTGLGFLMIAGAVFGLGGLICLISAIIQSGGVTDLLRGWFTALGTH